MVAARGTGVGVQMIQGGGTRREQARGVFVLGAYGGLGSRHRERN
jgi:hypothetical protein